MNTTRIFIVYSLLCFFSFFITPALADESFNDYLNKLYLKAQAQGFPEPLLDEVFAQIHPLSTVLKLDRAQAGLNSHSTIWSFLEPPHRFCSFCYINKSLSKRRIHEGREIFQSNYSTLTQIAKQYHVQPEYLISLWGLETNYGKVQGNFPEFSALATLAYDKRRRPLFEREFFSALKMVNNKPELLKYMYGSWAGAMGQCQFMPSRYLTLAIDHANRGYADIWHDQIDALASIANYLHQAGWHDQHVMVQAVKLDDRFQSEWAGLNVQKPLKEWLDLGVIPKETLHADEHTLYSILAPDHNREYAFLVDTENFNVIMSWNHSKSYALSVGLLAREIAL